MKVLVPHGTTQSGFGIGQLVEPPIFGDDEWARLCILTPCCGGTLPAYPADNSYKCSKCKMSYKTHPLAEDWNLTYIADISREVMESTDKEARDVMCKIAVDWLEGITGEKVEVSITWSV